MENKMVAIQVSEQGEQLVSGRDLHKFLEIGTPYKKWFDRMCEYGFSENVDFLTVDKNVYGQNGQLMPQKESDHLMKISIAKELGFKSAIELNKELEARKIQYKMNGTWVLSARYSEAGYTSIKQNELENGAIIYDRKWTGLGRDFLINLFNN